MKHYLFNTMMLVFGVLFSLNAHAYDAEINGIYYRLDTTAKTAIVTYKNKASFTPYGAYNINSSYSGAVNIPESFVYNSVTYSVTAIGAFAFEGCSGMTKITIPNSVTYIGIYAFGGCSGLTSLTIPNSVITIDRNAFSKCTGLTSVTIPKSVTEINDAFWGCSSLTSIQVEQGNPKYDSRENCNAIIETSTNKLLEGCKNTTIPSSITSIDDDAFWLCEGLTSLIIPDGVISIGLSAFYGCSGLTSLVIPDNCTSIDYGAFEYSGLFSINIPNGVTSIDGHTFCHCKNLASVTLPNSVQSIGFQAFYACTSLTTIDIPASVQEIGSEAFGGGQFSYDNNVKVYEGCNLTKVIVHWDTPISISSGTFSNAANCTLYVPKGKVEVYSNADGWKNFKSIKDCSPIIEFADAKVKALCVANWDTDSDGELSEAEAAAVTDLSGVFKGKTNITSFDELQYFTGMTSISNGTFSGCSNLTSVIIPNGIKTIGDYAFFSCKSLKSLTFPTSITSIGNYAFEECRSLQTLVIPTSVTSIGVSAFGYCDGLTSIKVEEKNLIYDSRDNCNAIIQKEKNTLITGCLNTIIPTTVRSIGQCAFRGCNGLTSMSIPSNIQEIGGSAFQGCVNLESLVLPATISSIGGNAFWDCNNLVSVVSERVNPVVLNSMSSTFSISYDYPNSLRRVLTVPYGTKSAYIAAGWTESFFPGGIIEAPAPVKNITFADANVKAICVKNWDTNGDGELSEEEAAAVTDLGKVFRGKTNITSFDELQYFTGLTSIGYDAFYYCKNLESVTIPNNVTSIASYAFSDCSGLTILTIPNSVTSIESYAFEDCDGLKSIILGNSVLSIGHGAFHNCSDLTTVAIPNSVTSIGIGAFGGCSSMFSITIPRSVTSIYGDVFNGCTSLMSIQVENGNIKYDSRDNCNAIIEKSSNTLIAGCKNTSIPKSVTSIGDHAFGICGGLASMNIPNSITSIGSYAFWNCFDLVSVTIPNSVKAIDSYAFYASIGLKEVTIPNSITSISIGTFMNCSSLISITIPSSVTSIDDSAFRKCSNLTSVVSEIEEPFTFGSNAFKDISSTCTLTIPHGTKDAYIAKGWTTDVFKGGIIEASSPNITFVDANVKAICVANWDTNGDGELSEEEAAAVTDLGEVFRGKTNITSFDELQYFTGLESIGKNAFYYCRSLTSVSIPNSVTSISDNAFYNCCSLTSVSIPNSVTSIGYSAFSGCI